MVFGIFGTPTKVNRREFRGGYRFSKFGKKLRSIPKTLINDAERKTLYKTLAKRGRQGGGLTRYETQGAINELIKNKSDNISKIEALKLTKHLGELTGYSNLKGTGRMAERYSNVTDTGKLMRGSGSKLSPNTALTKLTQQRKQIESLYQPQKPAALKEKAADQAPLPLDPNTKPDVTDLTDNTGAKQGGLGSILGNVATALPGNVSSAAKSAGAAAAATAAKTAAMATGLGAAVAGTAKAAGKLFQKNSPNDPGDIVDPERDVSQTGVGYYTKQKTNLSSSTPRSNLKYLGTFSNHSNSNMDKENKNTLSVISILVVDRQKSASKVNAVISEYGSLFLGRMGIPLSRGCEGACSSIINLIVSAEKEKITEFMEKISPFEGVIVKETPLPQPE